MSLKEWFDSYTVVDASNSKGQWLEPPTHQRSRFPVIPFDKPVKSLDPIRELSEWWPALISSVAGAPAKFILPSRDIKTSLLYLFDHVERHTVLPRSRDQKSVLSLNTLTKMRIPLIDKSFELQQFLPKRILGCYVFPSDYQAPPATTSDGSSVVVPGAAGGAATEGRSAAAAAPAVATVTPPTKIFINTATFFEWVQNMRQQHIITITTTGQLNPRRADQIITRPTLEKLTRASATMSGIPTSVPVETPDRQITIYVPDAPRVVAVTPPPPAAGGSRAAAARDDIKIKTLHEILR
jgi:hypothetical protein